MESTGRTDCLACTHLDGGVFCEPRGFCLRRQMGLGEPSPRCPSVMAVWDRQAQGQFACTLDPDHVTDRESGPSGVRWPRLDQAWGHPLTVGDSGARG